MSDPIIDLIHLQFLQLKALNADVKVNISEEAFDTQTYPANVNLLACSSKFGYFVGGTPKGIPIEIALLP